MRQSAVFLYAATFQGEKTTFQAIRDFLLLIYGKIPVSADALAEYLEKRIPP